MDFYKNYTVGRNFLIKLLIFIPKDNRTLDLLSDEYTSYWLKRIFRILYC
jgi:hypothetical protein